MGFWGGGGGGGECAYCGAGEYRGPVSALGVGVDAGVGSAMDWNLTVIGEARDRKFCTGVASAVSVKGDTWDGDGGPGEVGGKSPSCHVLGIRATGRSHVAVSTTP